MAPYRPAPECSPRFPTVKTRSRAGRGPTLQVCIGVASVGRQCTSPGHDRDNGLDRELKEGIVAAGRHLGWSARAVETFVVSVTGRPLRTCQHRELKQVLVAYLDLARMLRTGPDCQPRHGVVAGRGGVERV